MKATEKEIDCIDYSLHIRETYVELQLERLQKARVPILISPKGFIKHFWQEYHVTKQMLTPFKGAVYSIVFSVCYLIALPIVFVSGIIDICSSKSKKQIEMLNNVYLFDYDVSEVKSFEEFWDTKGLRNQGGVYYHLLFSEEDQLDCLKYWCRILYNIDESHFNDILEAIRNRIDRNFKKFYEENPNGHISMASPIDLLPHTVQTKFGNYVP